MKRPDFKRGDTVEFAWKSEIKVGEVYIVDKDGTFEQWEEPSYDIMVKDEGLYKHIRESFVRREIESDSPAWCTIQKIKSALSEKNAVFLIGPKKCGKTVCMRQLKQEYQNSRYINFKMFNTKGSQEVFEQIIQSITNKEDVVFLLDEIPYAFCPEYELFSIADALTENENTNTKVVVTGFPAVAVSAWARRAFHGDAVLLEMDFSSDISRFGSVKEYLQACLDETDISNTNTSNYLFDNENHLLNVEVLLQVCMAALHNEFPEEDSAAIRQAIVFLTKCRIIKVVPDKGIYFTNPILSQWMLQNTSEAPEVNTFEPAEND